MAQSLLPGSFVNAKSTLSRELWYFSSYLNEFYVFYLPCILFSLLVQVPMFAAPRIQVSTYRAEGSGLMTLLPLQATFRPPNFYILQVSNPTSSFKLTSLLHLHIATAQYKRDSIENHGTVHHNIRPAATHGRRPADTSQRRR